MRKVTENSMSSIVNVAGNDCGAIVFSIRAASARHCGHLIATRPREAKARRADSESRFLAMKKFSYARPARRIAARESRIFARIAQHRFATR
jgi:hypothetical protein